MGKEWYRGSGAKTASSSSNRAAAEETTPTGCISAFFHLFDFHHFHFPLNHQTTTTTSTTHTSSCSCLSFKQPQSSFLSPHSALVPTALKGTEAPSNNFESEDESSSSTSASASASVSLTSTSKVEEILNIPMGIQIKTSGDIIRSKVGVDTSSEISSSPGAKTPTLVARLMGLDLLPETHSPSFSSTIQAKSNLKPLQKHRKSLDGDIKGTRSLPETPRISSAKKSDVDYHHRFSLQINNDNMSACEESVISRLKVLKRKELKHEDENKSPGYYARQIMKQVKESVSRKVGMDITNTVRNREQAREELVSHFKNKKISSALTKVAEDSSPCRLRFLEPKTKDKNIPQQPPKPSSSALPQPQPKLQPVAEEQDEQKNMQQPHIARKGKKMSGEKFGSRLKKPQQTEEPFVRPSTANRVHIPDKKCKKTPLSNDLLNITVVPSLFPVKKHPSPPATTNPQKQVVDAGRPKRSSQLPSCSSQTYNKQETTYVHISRHDHIGDRCNDAGYQEEEAEYHEYIARILRRSSGLEKDTPVSLATWFSPSHSLNPSIFYYLEHFTAGNNKTKPSQQLSLRCNRKLLFHLVDEILTEFLKPIMKPWVISRVGPHEYFSNMDGFRLIDTLCSKIGGFPRADCRVLEDIDALVDKDLPEMKFQSVTVYEEEGEGIVSEIEKGILEALVHETAADFGVKVSNFRGLAFYGTIYS